jgi:hypothetical protein
LSLVRSAASGDAGISFDTQPIVHILDRYNNIVETGVDANLEIIASSPTADLLTGNAISATNGVARYTRLTLGGQVNTDYSVVFEIANGRPITSVTQENIQVGFGDAVKLGIQTQPQSLSGTDLTKTGQALAVQPVVEILDSYNNVVTNSNRVISVTLLRDGVSLDVKDRLVATSATPSNGLASFSAVAITGRPDGSYKLAFTGTGLTGVTSQALAVRHADPTTLEIVTPPTSLADGNLTKTGSLLSGQPKLRLLDFDGNIATEINGEVLEALVIEGGGYASTELVTRTAPQSPTPKNTAIFVNGEATFDNLAVIATPNVQQLLQFATTVRGNLLQKSALEKISFTNAAASKLVISTQPCAGPVAVDTCDTGVTGDDLQVQPVIEVQDRYGNRAVDFSGVITVSTANGRGTLSDMDPISVNEITVTANAGVATFNGLNLVALPGEQVELVFTSGSLSAAYSQPITVRAAESASLTVYRQPVGARTGEALMISPVVEIRDRFGNLAASDDVSRVSVSFSVNRGTTPDTRYSDFDGILSGTTTVTATGGRATFDDLVFIGAPGATYNLNFTGVNAGNISLAVASSANFSVMNASANSLDVSQQPTANRTGDLLGEAIVDLLDFRGNLAADDSTTVVRVEVAGGDSLARFVDESDQTVEYSATSTVLRQTASGGVVRFSNLRLVGTPGVSYELIFTANPDDLASMYSTTSVPISLTHAAPSALRVTAWPDSTPSDRPQTLTGEALKQQPALVLLDRYGNTATSDRSTVVTAEIYGASGAAITAGGTATTSAGVVRFSGLTVTGTPGTLHKLRFSAGRITVDETIGFKLRKIAENSLSYSPVSFSPSGTVTRAVVTDSPGVPVYSTTTSAAICAVNSSTGQVTINGVGTCAVNVTIPDTTYFDGGSVNANLVINKAQQAAIAISSATTAVDYLQSLRLAAEGGSGTGRLTFAVSGDCRVIGDLLIPSDAGSACSVMVVKSADANYERQVSDFADITVRRISQDPLIIGNPSTVSVGDINLFAHGGSGTGDVSYEVDPDTNNALCSIISRTVLRAAADGTCSVQASKATSTNYRVATSAQKAFTFSKVKQTVSFTSVIPQFPVAGNVLYQPIATASSSLAVNFSITLGSGTTCRFDALEPNKVRFLAGGACEITATQPGNAQFALATAKQLIAVGLRNQTITFAPLENRRFGQPPFMLTATASSGLAISFDLDRSVSAQACRVSATGLVTIESAGTCALKASQPGNTVFQAAPDVTQMFTVAPDRAGAPQLVSVSASDQTVTATFKAPSYLGGSAISRFRMEVSQVGSTNVYVNFACQANPLIPCQLSGLPNANRESYTVRIAAVTAAGIGEYSKVSSPVSTAQASAAVRSLTATSNNSLLSLSWQDPIAVPGVFQKYEVYVWPLGQPQVPSEPTVSISDINVREAQFVVAEPVVNARFMRGMSFSDDVTIPSADGYNLMVVTITDLVPVAQPENTSNGQKIGATTPGSPAELTLTDLKTTALVSWSEPTFDGGYPILGYQVRVNGELACESEIIEGQEVCSDSQLRVFELATLLPGTIYDIEVSAVNVLGSGEVSSVSLTIPPLVVDPPSDPSDPPVVNPVRPVVPSKPGPTKPGLPPPPVAPITPVAPTPPPGPTEPSEPGAGPSDPSGIGGTGDDNAPPVPFDPLATPEGVAALTDSLGKAAAAVGAIAAAALAAAGAAVGGSSGGSGSSRGSGEVGSIATINATHARYTTRRRGRGDKWKLWKKKWLTFADKPSIGLVVRSAWLSPLFSKIAVDGAYLRAALGSLGLLPTIAAAFVSLTAISINDGAVLTPQWQLFIALAVIGIFDAFAGLIGTVLFVIGTVITHGSLGIDDVRLLLGVIIVGYGPALLANTFRAFRRDPEDHDVYWWERLVDMAVLPFIGGWVTATMISMLPALAGTTMAVANHVSEFAIAVAIAITMRVIFEELVARWFPVRLDTLHPTDVRDPAPIQKWISASFRLSVFVFVTAALMGNVWQVWVGSAFFILPTIIGFYAGKFRNFPWIWRVLPTGIPGLALALLVASITTSIVGSWFGSKPDLALWSFALLPIPMLGLAVLAMIGREGNEGEIRWIRRPGLKWVYRIGGIVMLLATMELAGVIDIFPF